MIEILDYQETKLGLLMLRRRELLSRPGVIVTEVTLDHSFLMSSYHTESECRLASSALVMHQGEEPLSVMVGGLGLGFTAIEALRDSRVQDLQVIEFLPEVIAWLDHDWIPNGEQLKTPGRAMVIEDDVYQRLMRSPVDGGEVDLILIDVDHSPDEMLSPANAAFYTEDGLQTVRKHLKPGGVMGIWSTYPCEEFEALLGSVFGEVSIEVVKWRNDLVDIDKEDTLFFVR
ncbi:MAG: spermidine synthase [Planctomycetota bacterium]|jgi:spermidine synthase